MAFRVDRTFRVTVTDSDGDTVGAGTFVAREVSIIGASETGETTVRFAGGQVAFGPNYGGGVVLGGELTGIDLDDSFLAHAFNLSEGVGALTLRGAVQHAPTTYYAVLVKDVA